MSYVDRSETKMYSAGALFAVGGGYFMSRVLGAVAWIPMLVGFAAFALLKKSTDRNVAVLAALAAIIAQTAWFLVGAIAVPAQASTVLLDIVVNAILIAAIYLKPGYVSAGFALLWNVLGVVMTGLMLSATSGDGLSADQRALLAHIILRGIIVLASAAIMIFKAHPDLLPESEEEEEPMYN